LCDEVGPRLADRQNFHEPPPILTVDYAYSSGPWAPSRDVSVEPLARKLQRPSVLGDDPNDVIWYAVGHGAAISNVTVTCAGGRAGERTGGRRETWRRADGRRGSDGGSVSAPVMPDLLRGGRQRRKSPRTNRAWVRSV
jgi:hypothetical protein